MERPDAQRYVLELYSTILGRQPRTEEFDHWTKIAMDRSNPETILFNFTNSLEYQNTIRVRSIFPNGHYYSPIVDPSTVEKYLHSEQNTSVVDISGIAIDINAMVQFWKRMSVALQKTPFPEELKDDASHRYYFNNNIFHYGDAISLRAIIADCKPKKIIEIGSGFSTACMLDTIEEFGLATELICVEPFPERLKRLLRAEDSKRVSIIESGVQETDIEMYRSLSPGDILFIDSTHVLKTGSDVHFEFFHILPHLAKGVFVHFHDIHFPFEYPDKWVLELNHSWNEIYALRLFLMYNTLFTIRFWGSCLARAHRELVGSITPSFLRNPGGSIWIEKVM